MIRLLLLVIALIAGLVVGPDFAGHQGYVLISAANQTIEMSLTTLIIAIAVLIGALFLLELIIKRIFSVGSATRGWFSGRKVRKARLNTSQGLVKLVEGDWRQAEKLVVKGATHSDSPLLNYLAAAEAAQGRGETVQRDNYLKLASEQDGGNLAVALTCAKLQIRQEQYEQALATLQDIKQQHPHNPVLLELLKTTYLKLGDWQPLRTLLPQLVKADMIDQVEAARLEEKTECGLMERIAGQQGSEGLVNHWRSLPRKSRQRNVLIACFAKQLITRKADSEAYGVLREAVKKQSDDRLVILFPELNLPDYHPAIVLLSDVLRYDENNPVTHSAIAQLYMRDNKWAEAQEHFEKALDIRPDISDYAYLADVLDKLDQKQAAADISRQALTLLPSN